MNKPSLAAPYRLFRTLPATGAAEAAQMIHVRAHGHEVDRRRRMSTSYRTTSGPPLCGAAPGPRDLSRANAIATIEHARLHERLGRAGQCIDDAADMCPACLDALRRPA